MSVPLTADGHPKLPVWSTVGNAYLIWARNLPELLRMSWLWLIVYTPLAYLFWWYSQPYFIASMQAIHPHRSNLTPVLNQALGLLGNLITLPMLASIAVGWHRLLLRAERSNTARYLRFDRIVVAYAIVSFLCLLLPQAPSFLQQTFRYLMQGDDLGPEATANLRAAIAYIQFLASIATIGIWYAATRLTVYLPGKALDRQDITLARVWRTTRDNGWRLFFGHLLAILPIFLLVIPYVRITRAHGSRLSNTAASVAISVVDILSGMIAIAFLSLAYRHFFEEQGTQRAWQAADESSSNDSPSAVST